LHAKLRSYAAEVRGKIPKIYVKVGWVELNPHQEHPQFAVGMLVSVQNVAPVAKNEVGDGCDDAFRIGTTHKKNCRVGCHMIPCGAVIETVALADFEGSATLVAVTVAMAFFTSLS